MRFSGTGSLLDVRHPPDSALTYGTKGESAFISRFTSKIKSFKIVRTFDIPERLWKDLKCKIWFVKKKRA
jgi:hypothetical protein